MAIEDPYLDSNGVNGKPVNLGALKYDTSHIPFSQADNPVMTVVSFLAGLVDPRVAAAAAGKSIAEIRRLYEEEAKNDSEDKKVKDSNEENTDKQEGNKPSTEKLNPEQASKITMGVVGGRSDVVSSYVERQMYSQFMQLTSQQLTKIDLKLTKFSQLEQQLEMERRELEREREEMFLNRIALHRKVCTVDQLLDKAVKEAQMGNGAKCGLYIEEAGKIVRDDTRLVAQAEPTASSNGVEEEVKDEIKPISVELPQTYKYWSA
jgi:hypothetical protein